MLPELRELWRSFLHDVDARCRGPVALHCLGGFVVTSFTAFRGRRRISTFFVDLQRRPKLGHEVEALEVCRGIVAGLYRAAQHRFELLEYAVDCPSEAASRALHLWRRGRRSADLGRDFVDKHAPEWEWLVG